MHTVVPRTAEEQCFWRFRATPVTLAVRALIILVAREARQAQPK